MVTNNSWNSDGSIVVDTTLGSVTLPKQPAFISYLNPSVAGVTGDGTVYHVICDNTLLNVGSNYNTSTGIFTAPVTGIYIFNFTIYANNFQYQVPRIGYMTVETTALSYTTNAFDWGMVSTVGGTFQITASFLAKMTATDTAYPTVTVQTGLGLDIGLSGGAGWYTGFSGYLVM